MPFKLTIVTPERQVFDGEVETVVLPGAEGDFGVLAQHERLLAPLRTGEAQIRQRGEVLWAAIASGFAEVTGEHVVVLADACELAGEIDVARAQAAQAKAEREIQELRAREADDARLHSYEAALQRALVRQQVAAKPRI
jgi:F-type H+-transporting ATPase subunit epsilon